MRDGVLDRDVHVGDPQLRFQRSVHERDSRVDDALGMDQDVDVLVGSIVQPVRLDHLQALVGESRGVDGHLGAHAPRWMGEGLFGTHGLEIGGLVQERAARCGQGESRDLRHALADQALPDRRVL